MRLYVVVNIDGYKTGDILSQALDLVEETKDKGNSITQTLKAKQLSKIKSQEKESLLKAVAKGEIKLVKLLVDGGVDVNCRGYDDKTPLLVACSFVPEHKNSFARIVLVDILIRGGANPNVQDAIGRTPLMYAARHSLSPGIINLLIENGADPNIHDKKGRHIVSYIKRKCWPTYRGIFKEHLVAESSFHYNHLNQCNNCPMVPDTDFKELDSSLTKSNTIVKNLQDDVGDDILRRMSEPNESCYAKNLSILPRQKCKSYVKKSCAEYKPIPEKNQNEKQALRPCKDLCFRGCDTHPLYRNIENNHTCKRQHNRNIGSDATKNSVVFNMHSSEEMVDKRVTLSFDALKSSPHRRRTPFLGVSEIDKVMVQRGIQNTPAKLPPIS